VACVSLVGAAEGADLSLQPVAVMTAKAMMQPIERRTTRIFCMEPQVDYSDVREHYDWEDTLQQDLLLGTSSVPIDDVD
jgi:hypothetical protein